MTLHFRDREDYLSFRKQVNDWDDLHHLNELEKEGARIGDTVYIRHKYVVYTCEILGFTKHKCKVRICDGKLKDIEKLFPFDRIHLTTSDIGKM